MGRFAPPGYPNTTSTPSAFRHSMTASTARIISAPSFPGTVRARGIAGSRPVYRRMCGDRLGLDRHVGELELGPAAGADRVVELDDPAAAGALAAQLVAVVAVQQRGEQPADRHDRRDQEPEEERRALDPPDDAAGQAEEEADDEVGHGGCGQMRRTAQSSGDREADEQDRPQTAITRPATMPNTIFSATTRDGDQDDPRDEPAAEGAEGWRCCVLCSMPQIVSGRRSRAANGQDAGPPPRRRRAGRRAVCVRSMGVSRGSA